MIEDRIWRNWMVILAAFRTMKDVLTLPFNYEKVLNVMAGMIQRQNDLIININIQNESDQ